MCKNPEKLRPNAVMFPNIQRSQVLAKELKVKCVFYSFVVNGW